MSQVMAIVDNTTFCIKIFLFVLNFIIWILGMSLLWIGVMIRVDPDFYEYTANLEVQNYVAAAYLAMAVGALILVVAFLGCCGVLYDSPCLLIAYLSVMTVFVIMELAVAILVWKTANPEKMLDHFRYQINRHIENRDTNDLSRRFLDLMQMHLECCGKNSYLDYHNDIPDSCHSDRTNNIFIYGCGEIMRWYLIKWGGLIGGIAMSIILVQICALVFTGILFANIRQAMRAFEPPGKY